MYALNLADYVLTADLEAQVRIKCGEILTFHSELTNKRRLLWTRSFSVSICQHQIATSTSNNKNAIQTQLNATIHDFQSYKDNLAVKFGSADAEIRRLKKELQVCHELYTDISRGKESLAREEDTSLFLERKQFSHNNVDDIHTPVLMANESFAPKCFKSGVLKTSCYI